MRSIPDLAQAATFVVGAFLAGIAGITGTQILSGAINTRRLFYGRRKNGDYYFSPERVQLLLFTVWVAFTYLLTVLGDRSKLPDVDTQTLALLGGSHALYLGGKAFARLAPVHNGKD